ncbi:lachesin-like [Panulirus ornatus]|uniref:lachesin-like n=1 Tax=Panulirus ornatus TaxID=150431 RepID=UPI003A8B5DD4
MGGCRPVSTWVRLLPVLLASHAVSFSPQFSAPVANVTVARGRDAKFTCLVRHLGGYRVGWVKADTKAIQAIHTHVITHNPRVHVSFDDHSTWHLLIKQVTEEDKGPYMCQINTDPMISQMGFLEVLRPPEIDDTQSSGDEVVTEGDRAVLKCVATGHPLPTMTWVREDSATIMVSDGLITKPVSSWEGEILELNRVSRDDMGAYLCIARNSVPPQVSKRVLLHVHFHPIIHVPNQLIGSPYGSDVTLECKVEASPKPVTFWQNSQGEMLMSSSKYSVKEEHNKPGGYAVHMRLTIHDLTAPDIGHYTCVAKNSIGEVDSTINVYYIAPPTTTPPRIINFIETNSVGGGQETPLPSPGLISDLGNLDVTDKDVYRFGSHEGSGKDPWYSQPGGPPAGPFLPTSEGASLPGMRPWFPENSEKDTTVDTSSSSANSIGISSGCRHGKMHSTVIFLRSFLSLILGVVWFRP